MIERAEINTRPKATAKDKRDYTGIARHPLARRWLLRRMVDADAKARQAEGNGDSVAESRWRMEIRRVQAEAARMGLSLEGV